MTDNINEESTSTEPTAYRGVGRPRRTDCLNGTRASRKTNFKLPHDGTDEGVRSKVWSIPKRLEALYILFADSRDNTGLNLTRDELDINPATKSLGKLEKDALVKWWPKFVENQNKAREIRRLRDEETQFALKAHKNASIISRREGLDSLSLPEQMKVTSKVYDRNIQHAALTLAAMSVEDLHTDPLALALYRLRVQNIKDLAWVREKITDLAERIEKEATGEILTMNAQSEAFNILQNADALLLSKGIKQ